MKLFSTDSVTISVNLRRLFQEHY